MIPPIPIRKTIVLALTGACLASAAPALPVAPPGQGVPARDALSPQGETDTPGWLARVSEEIRAAEYRFSPVTGERGVWSAPNRAQGLRSRVMPEGIEVFPRATGAGGTGAPWKLVLGTKAFGREGEVVSLHGGEVSVDGTLAELERGRLVEWFENTEAGIEHGWTIASRPVGIDPLVIVLAIGGDLSLRVDEGRRSGVFVDGRGERCLAYRGLRAWDAQDRELEARLVPRPEGAAVEVDDAGAVYPVTVDPLISSPAWTMEPDHADAFFGWAVSSAGDVDGDGFSDVVVGAKNYDNGEMNEGRAFLYCGSAAGLLTSPAWTAEPDQENAAFGNSVSTAGDVNGDGYSDVVVGARLFDDGQTDEGRALVYHGSAGGLAATEAWTAEANQASAQLGISVSTAGDVNGDGFSDVVVGAYFYDNGQADEGRAFVYLGNGGPQSDGGGWVSAPRQRRVGGGPLDLLGLSDSHDSFRIRASLARGLSGFDWAAPGTATAALEWQAAPLGQPFGDTGLGSAAPTSASPVLFDELVQGLAPGRMHRWRARFRTDNPLLPVTPWFSIPWNGAAEGKLRTPPPPGFRRKKAVPGP